MWGYYYEFYIDHIKKRKPITLNNKKVCQEVEYFYYS